MAYSRRSQLLPRAIAALVGTVALQWLASPNWCFPRSMTPHSTPGPAPPARAGAMLLCNPSHKKSYRNADVAMAGQAKEGVFTPVVLGAKKVLGDKQLAKVRGEVIKAHGEVIQRFVETSDTRFGQFALKTLFDLADTDCSGHIDKEELRIALIKLGFTWVEDDGKLDQLFNKMDEDGNQYVDWDEFTKRAPTVLKQSFIKLAKSNGGELGFLS
mmetsp:Transcript_88171/g.248078  ORF Transcript_88171/g.248078 Transcript_88171/m.248078 type:complete len:214 (+) Transcript_88171:78-719(+)